MHAYEHVPNTLYLLQIQYNMKVNFTYDNANTKDVVALLQNCIREWMVPN